MKKIMVFMRFLLETILTKILEIFSKPTIPYPEEKPDFTKNMKNTNITKIVNDWLTTYAVPPEYWDYWRIGGVDIKLTLEISYPAGAYEDSEGKRHVIVRPEWANVGVIAHEQAHNSYDILTDVERDSFNDVYIQLLTSNKLLKLLDKQNNYMNISDIEAHAEIYRYLGQYMPEELKQFYPKLF